MKPENRKIILSLWLLVCLFWQAIPVRAQQSENSGTIISQLGNQDNNQIVKDLFRQARGAEFPAIFEKFFGESSVSTMIRFENDSERLLQAVVSGANKKAAEILLKQASERKEKAKTKKSVVTPKTIPVNKPAVKKPIQKSKGIGFNLPPKLDWRQFAFGFQPLPQQQQQDDIPEIKFTQNDKELIAEGEQRRSFETKEVRGTRTQKAFSRNTNDGKTFGVEIKNTEIIEATSKTDGKSFRTETVLSWGAEVAACPDINGVTVGTGKAKATVKTTLNENGQTTLFTTDLDLQGKLTGYVNDQAEFTHYDFQVEAYLTNSGAEEAFRRKLSKEIKLKDGKYGILYDIKGNTVEVITGGYRSPRIPAKFGKATGRKLTPMSDDEAKSVDSSLGAVVPAIWVQANNMYETAQKSWQDGGCVEVICKAAKESLKPDEEISITAETAHKLDGGKVNAQLEADGGSGTITPETQAGTPTATFMFSNVGENGSTVTIKSISKRGIGEGTIGFLREIDEPEEAGAWTGKIGVRRHHYVEREKRSGANLAENGGYFETLTYVNLQLTGRLDHTVDATNANIAVVSGTQTYIDHEYDRYKVDEGYCGKEAVPYKGEKEITRTSTTKAEYNKETRVYLEMGGTGGTISFSLPEINGTTVHKYVHQSECAEHDRANTNEATDENAATVGGSFSFSFPIDPSQKIVRGTISVTEEDGSKTEYTWELRRK